VPVDNVQVVLLNEPVLLVVKDTVPVGVIAPVPDASLTVTVHVDPVLSRTLAGEHVTLVALARTVEVTVNAAAELLT